MSKQVIDLTSTGLVISNLVLSDTSNPHIAWCKRISNDVDVDTSGTTLTERGSGIYTITNPNVTEDTDFRVYVATDTTKYAVGIFSPADGDIAKETTVNTRLASSAYVIPDNSSILSVKAKTDTINWTDVTNKLDASAYVTPDNSSILLVKAKTDTINWVDVTSRLASSAYTAPDNSSITLIKAKTDTINWTDVTSRLASVDYVTPDNSSILLVKAKTDTINWLDIDRLSGLMLENAVEDDIIRDFNGNKTSSVIYLYNSKTNADTHDKVTGVINTYNVTAAYTANKLTLFRMTLE